MKLFSKQLWSVGTPSVKEPKIYLRIKIKKNVGWSRKDTLYIAGRKPWIL